MSIPLDRLYQYIETTAKDINDNVIIYHFYPHGSKKTENIQELVSVKMARRFLKFSVYCHDQEPLNYSLYQNIKFDTTFGKILRSLSMELDRNFMIKPTIYNKKCLIHSEQRSDELAKYQKDQCVTVYYWSHGIIARDWFRFAEHVAQKKQVQKTFLIYNRAWAGTREYRLRFAEHLIRLGLQDQCRTSINPVEPELGIHYELHNFKNPTWRPTVVLENFFPTSTAHSHYSADFDIKDYEATDIEVVLETLFDDSRLHLTEKSLRPIACGQPFILAGTHGSLEYLRGYGFKTFGHVWDERYDLIEDPEERLITIADLMKQIANWSPQVRERKMARAQAIADYNKKHFFSEEFFNQITEELKNNLKSGLDQLTVGLDVTPFVTRWEKLLNTQEILSYLKSPNCDADITLNQLRAVLKIAKKLQK